MSNRIEHRTQREQVRARIGFLALDHLRRHVGRRPDHGPGHGHLLALVQEARDAKVHQLQHALAADHHVLGLQVAVHDARRVRVLQRQTQRVSRQGPQLRQPEARLFREAAQGGPVDELGDDVSAFPVARKVEDLQNVSTPAFGIDRYKVTNGQYLKFMEAGGYQDRSLWTPAAWDWKAQQGIAHPLSWTANSGAWYYRTMFDEIPLPPDWPAYVSHAEARAYARWAGKRLPTEAEWQRASQGISETPGRRDGYLDLKSGTPSPVNAFPEGRSDLASRVCCERMGMDVQPL